MDDETSHVLTLRSVVDAATAVVDAIGDGQLAGVTPCQEWDVRAVLNHMVATATMLAIAAAKGHLSDADAKAVAGDVLGDDFRDAWRGASDQLLRAFEQPDVLGKVLVLPFGDTPGDVAVDLAALEIGIHAADLVRATDQHVADHTPFASVLTILRARVTDAWRAPGILDGEQPVPPDADVVDELLAYAGRRVAARDAAA